MYHKNELENLGKINLAFLYDKINLLYFSEMITFII